MNEGICYGHPGIGRRSHRGRGGHTLFVLDLREQLLLGTPMPVCGVLADGSGSEGHVGGRLDKCSSVLAWPLLLSRHTGLLFIPGIWQGCFFPRAFAPLPALEARSLDLGWLFFLSFKFQFKCQSFRAVFPRFSTH